MSSQNSYVEVLNAPVPQNVIRRLEIGSYRDNQVKMRPLRWALIQHDWCPYKMGKFGDAHAYVENAM